MYLLGLEIVCCGDDRVTLCSVLAVPIESLEPTRNNRLYGSLLGLESCAANDKSVDDEARQGRSRDQCLTARHRCCFGNPRFPGYSHIDCAGHETASGFIGVKVENIDVLWTKTVLL